MTLADLRKLSIKKQYRIRFVLSNGMECVVTQNGIAQVPALRGIPNFNLEEELASVGEFLVEPVAVSGGKTAPVAFAVRREEMAALTSATGAAAHGHDDHDDE